MARKKKIWVPENVVKGKSGTYGRYYINTKTAELIYQAEKKDRRFGIFHATDSLAIDVKTLNEAKDRGVKIIIVKIRSTGDRYATTLERFNSDAAVMNFDKRGGSLQRYLPLSNFVERRSDKL